VKASDPITPDAQAIILACAQLSARQGDSSPDAPFSAREWADLAQRIFNSSLKSPAAMLGKTATVLREELGLTGEQAERLRRRLDRGGQLAIETERLASLGIWVLTRADSAYPTRLREVLGALAPPVLFGAGKQELLTGDGVAIVGSRNVSEDVLDYTRSLARKCWASGYTVVTGAAKGVDRSAIQGALDAEGQAVGIIADSLERMIRSADVRRPIAEGRLLLASPYHPGVRFTVGTAMARNKYIYALAQFGIVVESTYGEGGTWAGAREVLEKRWVPLLVRDNGEVSKGNQALIQQGAVPFPRKTDEIPADLAGWLEGATRAWHDTPGSASRPVRDSVPPDGGDDQGPGPALRKANSRRSGSKPLPLPDLFP
jgi:DNA processing protein